MHACGRLILSLMLLSGCVSAPAQVITPALLEGRAWTIEAYNDGAGLATSANVFPMPGWIVFRDGSLDGTPGCGSLIGRYTISDTTISIRSGAIVTGSCLWERRGEYVDLFDDSTDVTDALNRSVMVAEQDGRVHLNSEDGKLQVVLARRE